MNWATWVTLAAFAATSVAFLVTITSLRDLYEHPPGPRTRRLRFRRMGLVVGWWQISCGACILAIGGMWTSAIAVLGMGCMFLLGSHFARKTGLPPWWAPE